MKQIISGALEGIRTGGFIYLLVLALKIQPSPVTASNIVSVLMMSALIGILTAIIFSSERFSYLTALILHFMLTSILVCGMMIYNGWLSVITSYHFWLDFILIYLFIWALLRLILYLQTQKINTALRKRRNKKKGMEN